MGKNYNFKIKKLKNVFLLAFIAFLSFSSYGQCAYGTGSPIGPTVTPTFDYQSTGLINAGRYFLMNVINGATYNINTCQTDVFDTQITVYNEATMAFIAYNDDYCRLRSSVTFVASFTGEVRVRLNEFNCNPGGGEESTVQYSEVSPAPNVAPVITAADNGSICPGVGNSRKIATNVSVTDVDDTTLDVASIQISSGYVNGEGTLTLGTGHPNIAASFNAAQGKLTLQGPATLAQFESAIEDVSYTTSNTNATGTRQFTITLGAVNFLSGINHLFHPSSLYKVVRTSLWFQ